MADVRRMRDLMLESAKIKPEFPIQDAMRILDICTPEYLNIEGLTSELLDYRAKPMPERYLNTVKPQTRNDVHRDMFYDFLEWVRTVR